MGCRTCSQRRSRQVSVPEGTTVQTSGLQVAPASTLLPWPPVIKPPGGWGLEGLPARTPEEAADRLAGQLLAKHQFTNMQAVYKTLVNDYCSRLGSPCYSK